MAAAKKSTSAEVINVPAIEKKRVQLRIVGDAPLIMHAWDPKNKRMMLEKQMGVAKAKAHDVKNPVEDFIMSMYWLTEPPAEMTEDAFAEAISKGAKFGFPTVAFKASAVSGAYRSGVLKNKVVANGAIHIAGEFAVIESDTPKMREDIVRIGMGTADLRYRGQFDNWSTVLDITYNAGVFTLEQIVNMFNLGGFACGIGEWRPEKGGEFGSYHCE